MKKKIYIIEWFVDYEPDSEEENCHEVLDGCGYFDSFEEAMDCCRFLLETDKEEILQDYPEAAFEDIETDDDHVLTMGVYDADADFKAVTYKALEIMSADDIGDEESTIEGLSLSGKSYCTLKRLGLDDILTIVKMSNEDFIDKHNLGPKKLEEIYNALTSIGYKPSWSPVSVKLARRKSYYAK